MLRTLPTNFCMMSSSAQSPSNFLWTFATPVTALLVEVTSCDARLSNLRPVHVEMDNSTSIALEDIDGAEFVSVSLTLSVGSCCCVCVVITDSFLLS